jgi:hypothetical protein
MGKSQEVDVVLDAPCEFSALSMGGDSTARLGVRISKELLKIKQAEELLCGRRLSGSIFRCPPGQSVDQQVFEWGPDVTRVDSTFDVKRYASSPKYISFGVTFAAGEIDKEDLTHFPKTSGRFVISEVKELEKPERKSSKDQPLPGQQGLPEGDDGWKGYRLENLFKGAFLKSLVAADLITCGDVATWLADGKKNITDLAGVGAKAADNYSAVMERFWIERPFESKV